MWCDTVVYIPVTCGRGLGTMPLGFSQVGGPRKKALVGNWQKGESRIHPCEKMHEAGQIKWLDGGGVAPEG